LIDESSFPRYGPYGSSMDPLLVTTGHIVNGKANLT
jgi:hypothetical protein